MGESRRRALRHSRGPTVRSPSASVLWALTLLRRANNNIFPFLFFFFFFWSQGRGYSGRYSEIDQNGLINFVLVYFFLRARTFFPKNFSGLRPEFSGLRPTFRGLRPHFIAGFARKRSLRERASARFARTFSQFASLTTNATPQKASIAPKCKSSLPLASGPEKIKKNTASLPFSFSPTKCVFRCFGPQNGQSPLFCGKQCQTFSPDAKGAMCKSSLPLAICATTQLKKTKVSRAFLFPPQTVLFVLLATKWRCVGAV